MKLQDLYDLKPWELVTCYDKDGMCGHMWAQTALAIYEVSENPDEFRFEWSNHNGIENKEKYDALMAKHKEANVTLS